MSSVTVNQVSAWTTDWCRQMWVQRGFQNVSINFKNWLSVLAYSSKMPFYAVAKGRSVGIYQSWAECEAQVKGFSGARYKKFDTESNAQNFITGEGGAINAPRSAKPNQNYTKNAVPSTDYNQKRSFSTFSNQQTNGNSSGNNSQTKSQAWQDSIESDEDSNSDDDLNMIINKQMDDIEKRLKTFEKGVDKIEKKDSKGTARKAIMIEPPQTKKARITNKELQEDSEGFVQVYTDGACSSNGRSGAKAGIGVFWGDDHTLNTSEPVSGRATNNCGEIQAATWAIKQAIDNGIKKLAINTDSQFLINSVTKWLPGWKRKGWKLKTGEPVKNEIDFKELDSLQHKLNVKWNYVEAHRGIYGNEMADQLAKAGAEMYKK